MKYLIVFVLCFSLAGCAAHRQRMPETPSYVDEHLPFATSEAMAGDAVQRLAKLYPPGRTAVYLQKPVLTPDQLRKARERIAGEKASRLTSPPAPAPARNKKKSKSKKKETKPASEIASVVLPEPRLFTDAFEGLLRQAGFRIVSVAGEGPGISWIIDRLAADPHEPETWYLRMVVADRNDWRLISRVYDSQGMPQGGFAEGRVE